MKFIAYCLLLLPTAAFSQLPVRWICETSRPVAQSIDVFRGETVALEPQLLTHGEAATFPAGTAVALYLQTNGMGSAWWSVPGATSAVAGRVSATFAPSNDVGADAYSFFVSASSASGRSYRAFGTLSMRDSPGFSPASAPAPSYYPTLAAELAPYVVPLLSAAFVSPDTLVAATNDLALVISNGVAVARSETAAHAGRSDNPHAVTAAQAGALTAAQTTNAVLALRPTGVPVWSDSEDSSVFATLETGTGMVWRVVRPQWFVTVAEYDENSVYHPAGTYRVTGLTGIPMPTQGAYLFGSHGGTVTISELGISVGNDNASEWVNYYATMTPYGATNYTTWSAENGGGFPVALFVDTDQTVTNFITRLATTNDLALLLTSASLEEWWDAKQAILNNLYYSKTQADGKYARLTDGALTNPAVVGTLTLNGASVSQVIGVTTNSSGATNGLRVVNGALTNSYFFSRAGGSVFQTGQTNVDVVGDDGWYRAGIPRPTPRWEIVGAEGTVETNQVRSLDGSGLIFARNTTLFAATNWSAAITLCEELNYGGATDWRLPNELEMFSIADLRFDGPALSNIEGTARASTGNPFFGTLNLNFWCSGRRAGNTTQAWIYYMSSGFTSYDAKTASFRVWPVRGGALP